jgi:hypothetical protein
VSGENRLLRKRLVVGALVGGVLLGVLAMLEVASNESIYGSVTSRQLKATELTVPVLYDARLVTNVSARVTLHDENPIPVLNTLPPFRDLRNHTLTDNADVVVNVGTKLQSLQATPDPRTGKLTVVLHGDPDPAKSDLVVQVAIDPATEKISNSGNWGDVLVNGFFGTAKALAQAAGKNFISPVDNTNTVLTKLAHLLMYDAITSGPNNCTEPGIKELNKENHATLASFASPDQPKTLKQALAKVVFDTYAAKHQQALDPSDIDIRFDLSPAGLPNPFHQELVQARAATNAGATSSYKRIELQGPGSYPPCSVSTSKGGH